MDEMTRMNADRSVSSDALYLTTKEFFCELANGIVIVREAIRVLRVIPPHPRRCSRSLQARIELVNSRSLVATLLGMTSHYRCSG